MTAWNNSYRELAAWRAAMSLAVRVHRLTAHFPAAESQGLTSRLRHAASSIPARVAEGQRRGSSQEWLREIVMAQRWLSELETQILIAAGMGLLGATALEDVLSRCAASGRKLRQLQDALLRAAPRSIWREASTASA